MKAIHGDKAKNDKIDSYKIAKLLQGGNFPLVYQYPKNRRATRDLLRRKTRLVRYVQKFASYRRLVKCKAESAGKLYGTQGNKIGNAYLRWAFSEAVVLHLRE